MLSIVAELLTPNSDCRIAAVLLRITDNGQSDIDGEQPGAPLTQELLGQLANASRRTVARFVTRATRQGWISWRYGQVRILDPRGLERFAVVESRF